MKTRSLLAFAVACTAVAACQGLKDAFSAHTDTVARAGSQELSVQRLGDLLGKTPLQIQPTKENASVISELWVDYQLLAMAAAKNDSLTDKKAIDAATQSYTANMMLRHFQTVLDSTLAPAPASEAGYDAGADGVLDARHILFSFPVGATPAQKDSVHRKAQGVLAQVNDKNFADMARKYSSDGSAQQGGNLGVFPRAEMVKEFGDAVAGLKPGQISGLVQSQFGYHIIQRLTYAQAKAEYDAQYPRLTASTAERAYVAKLDTASNIVVQPGAAQAAKVAAAEIASHRNDNTVLATFKGGTLTTARMIVWLDGMPPQQNIPAQLQAAPDSLINQFLHGLAGNEVLLQKADSMKLGLTPEEKANIYTGFSQWVTQGWATLNVDPKSLADSAKTESGREKLAAARVDSLIDAILAGSARPVAVPTPLRVALEAKYKWNVNQAGIDRAVELARNLRTTADSARAAARPPSQVPLPGAPPVTTTPPATTTPPVKKP